MSLNINIRGVSFVLVHVTLHIVVIFYGKTLRYSWKLRFLMLVQCLFYGRHHIQKKTLMSMNVEVVSKKKKSKYLLIYEHHNIFVFW